MELSQYLSSNYIRAIVTKTMWSRYKNRPEFQWDIIEDPEINPHSDSHMIFDKMPKTYDSKKNTFAVCRRLKIDLYLSSFIEISSKQIKI
jgi:hypothetical protein